MNGIIYITCTSVGRYILKSHLKYHPSIPILGVINLDRSKAIRKANYDSLYDIAYDNDIDILYCVNVNSESVLSFVKKKSPTLIIQSGWSQKFGNELLSIPKYGCIGEHPSPLPEGRGAACVNWAIINNKTVWGDSFFKMVEQYDAGQVYAQNMFNIENSDNVFTIYEKVAISSYFIIKNYLHNWYNGSFNSLVLDESKATYYKRRKPKDGELDFLWNANKILNYVRALSKPYPGAFFYYKSIKIVVWEAKLLNESAIGFAEHFSINHSNRSLLVVSGNKRVIALQKIQIEDFPEIKGCDFFDILKRLI